MYSCEFRITGQSADALFPFGYSGPRTFTITADDSKATTYVILTEEGNERNTIKLIGTQTLYPFNN